MAKPKVLEMVLDSHLAAVDYAKSESTRTNQSVWVVEYREKESPDDMRFFEVVTESRLSILMEYYDVLQTLRF